MPTKRLLVAGIAATMLASGAGTALAGGAVIFNGGWGCRTCGFSNGTSLSGTDVQTPIEVQAITLPSGELAETQED